MKKIELKPNVSLTMINTAQFKDIVLTIRFLAPVTRRAALVRNLLSQMLCDRCEKWPTKQALSVHLDELYGASVSCRGSSYGKTHVFEFRFKCLNDQYTQENTFERLFKTACEFVYRPLKQGELLDKELFEEAKRELMMANARKLEHPQSRAVASACALFGKGYALAETQLYTAEEIQSVTLEEATQAAVSMIENDPVMMFVVGKIDEEKTKSYISRFFPFESREKVRESVCPIVKDELEEASVTMKIDQTCLVMIFSSPITILSDDYWKLRVANAMFGQLPTSLLFMEVREKRSLCYSVNSSTMGYEGGILVTVGIQKENLDETKQCILEQAERLAKKDFTQEDLNTAKNMLKNAVYGSYDDPSSILNFAFQNVLLNRSETAEDCIDAIENTTADDIQRIFSNLKHCTTFALEQEEDNEEAY